MNATLSMVPSADGRNTLVRKKYVTDNIVKVVLDCYKDSKSQLAALSKGLKGKSDFESCSNIWHFIKNNIKYQVDPPFSQLCKTPARLVADRVGDCKSFSIFSANCLYNLGIKGAFRFVSFGGSQIPTHVYVVAFVGGKEIKIDAVIEAFNEEKPYTKKIDYTMEGLYVLSGVGEATPTKPIPASMLLPKGKPVYNPEPGVFQVPLMADGTTTYELIDAALLKQRLEIEGAITSRVAGIGATVSANTSNMVDDLNNQILATISGTHYVGGFFKKLLNGVKKVVTAPLKLVQKVVMLPQALLLNKQIPDSAMFWVYGLIPDNLVNKFPANVQQKREKVKKLAKLICNVVVIKEDHFWKLVENGIMKKTGKTALAYLAEKFKIALSGLPPGIGVWGAVIGFVIKLVQGIVGLFKKKGAKPPTDTEVNDMGPSDSDWAGVAQSAGNAAEAITTAVAQQQSAAALAQQAAGNTQAALDAQAAYQQSLLNTPVVQPYTSPTPYVPDYSAQQYAAAPAEQYMPAPAPVATGGMDSKTMLMVGGGLLAVMLLMNKKGGR